jgi:ferredoxin/flavodoxin---NADP+ reductase
LPMHSIVHKQVIAEGIKRIDISAGDIAAKILPGQFMMVRPTDRVHAMPLTPADADGRKGVVSFIIHEVGEATRAFGALPIGSTVANVMGPLGRPAQIERYGVVVCVATGIGAAQILPICRALKKKGNKVLGVVGAKSKKVLMLESQMRVVCDELFITTNDGSYERKGLATQVVSELLTKYTVKAIYAIGSVEMMQSASDMGKDKGIPVRVTLNPYMLNGLGICGSCRVRVGGQYRLACVEGPEFNGHEVDFKDMEHRDHLMKEKVWDRPNRLPNPRSGGLQTFMKSFLGSAKKKI